MLREGAVGSGDGHLPDDCLSDKDTIEHVVVVERKIVNFEGMNMGYRQVKKGWPAVVLRPMRALTGRSGDCALGKGADF